MDSCAYHMMTRLVSLKGDCQLPGLGYETKEGTEKFSVENLIVT